MKKILQLHLPKLDLDDSGLLLYLLFPGLILREELNGRLLRALETLLGPVPVTHTDTSRVKHNENISTFHLA